MEPSLRLRWLLALVCVALVLLVALWFSGGRSSDTSAPAAARATPPAPASAPSRFRPPARRAPAPAPVAAAPAPLPRSEVSGRVVDSDGNPVPGAQVGASSDAGSRFASSAPDGSFTLGGLEGGTVNLFATAPGFAAEQLRGVAVGSDDLVIVLYTPARILGRLEYRSRPDVLYVRLCHHDRDFDREVCLKSSYYSPPDDTFELERLPRGSYDLVFSSSRHELQRMPVTLRPGDTLEVGTVVLPH